MNYCPGKRFPGCEMVVKGALADAGVIDYIGQAGLAISRLREQVYCGREDLVPSRFGPGFNPLSGPHVTFRVTRSPGRPTVTQQFGEFDSRTPPLTVTANIRIPG